MPLTLTWHEIALRLALSAFAGALVGIDRGEHGHPAGLRTTMLVCLAAAVSMIQANLLLATAGRTGDSFISLDLMRLPLGILTGMGFIGGGAILRRDSLVVGVTTAATLWFVTIIGLCLGGGQIGLGLAALGLGMFVLAGLRWVDRNLTQDLPGNLHLTTEGDGRTQDRIRATVEKAGYKISISSVGFVNQSKVRELEFNLKWRGKPGATDAPAFLNDILADPSILSAAWKAS
jgi:putative Mg2+ transporter-C (MgtC) family protein